jgi:quinol monooxygenase YgiN
VIFETAVNYSRQGHGGFLHPEEAPANPQQGHEKEKHMIHATIRMTIPPQKSDEILKIIRSVVELCRYDSGCLSSRIYGDLQEKNVLMLEEVWRAEEDLTRHVRSGEYLNLLLVLEMALNPPEIRFDTISSSTGIETIEKARSHTT